jgi:hypothetical protein
MMKTTFIVDRVEQKPGGSITHYKIVRKPEKTTIPKIVFSSHDKDTEIIPQESTITEKRNYDNKKLISCPIPVEKETINKIINSDKDDGSVKSSHEIISTKKKYVPKKCPHGRVQYLCKQCGGKGICSHGIFKTMCKKCKGSSFCSHGIRKTRCQQCGGSAFCSHGKLKYRCKLCGGRGLCSHGARKERCKICHGSEICAHGARRDACRQCGGTGNLCKGLACGIFTLIERPLSKIKGLCGNCFRAAHPDKVPPKLQMRVEILVIAEVERQLKSIVDDAVGVIWDCSPNCETRCQPDRIWLYNKKDKPTAVHLEIDEHGNQHEDDDNRVARIQSSMSVTDSWLVRYNTGSTATRLSSVKRRKLSNGNPYWERSKDDEWDRRISILVQTIKGIHERIVNGESPTIDTWKTKLFFD